MVVVLFVRSASDCNHKCSGFDQCELSVCRLTGFLQTPAALYRFVHIPDGDEPQAWVFVCLDNNEETGGVPMDEQGAPSRA